LKLYDIAEIKNSVANKYLQATNDDDINNTATIECRFNLNVQTTFYVITESCMLK